MRNSPQFTLGLIAISWSLLAINHVFAQEYIKRDEKIVFFPTAAYLNPEKSHWHLPIHGWVFEPANSTARRKTIEFALSKKYGLKTTAESKPIFNDRINLLLADNERGKKVKILIAGEEHTLPPSAENGHFKGSLQLSVAKVEKAINNGVIDYQAILRRGDERKFTGRVFVVQPKGVSVISDIDDTIKVSNVLDRKQLMKHSFYLPFTAVEGMSEYYQALGKNTGASFHFVSSSPWHFFEPLRAFAMDNGFPPAEYHLKNFRFKDRT